MSFSLPIHKNNVGRLIGTKGATIRALQDELGVKIVVSPHDQGEIRYATVSSDDGDQGKVERVAQELKRRFDDNPGRNSTMDRNSQNQRGYNDYGQRRNDRNDYRARDEQTRHYSSQRDSSYYGNRNNNNYSNNPPQNSVKRAVEDNDDWDDGDKVNNNVTSSNQAANDYKKADDWEMDKPSGGPSVNVYTRSSTSDYQKPRDSFNSYNSEKKFKTRNDYYDRPPRPSIFDVQPPYEEKEYVPIDWDKINAEAEEARKARWANCPIMLKNFYEEHPMTKTMTSEEIAKFRFENNKIQVTRGFDDKAETDPDLMPKPITKFEYGFERWPDILHEIKKNGFEKPSPIQSQMWPILLKGEDCIGIAQTGTGKTLAFLLPALIHTDGQPHPRGIKARGGPNVLVLAPTRELAIQIEREVAKYSFRGIRAVCLYGGNDRRKQIEVVESGVEVIIATPGRLNDLVAANHIKIESITYLILDEADRMLDMGFEPQIRKLLLDIRDDRVTVMTSATWPSGVRRLATQYMQNPYQVVIGSLDLAATHTVTQKIEIMDENDKENRIMRFAKEEMKPDDKAIIFCCKKDRADWLSCEFVLKGISCQAIHGNREQRDREQALDDIKDGTVRILIATDVASRGIDIQDVTYVVNFDFPRNIEEYVHRVGRTGRAGRSGTSLSFLTRQDWSSAKELIEILKEANQEVPAELEQMAERYAAKKAQGGFSRGGFRGGRGRDGGGRGRDHFY